MFLPLNPVSYEIETNQGSEKNMLFGREDLLPELTGPGAEYICRLLQTLPSAGQGLPRGLLSPQTKDGNHP